MEIAVCRRGDLQAILTASNFAVARAGTPDPQFATLVTPYGKFTTSECWRMIIQQGSSGCRGAIRNRINRNARAQQQNHGSELPLQLQQPVPAARCRLRVCPVSSAVSGFWSMIWMLLQFAQTLQTDTQFGLQRF
jgi:hypothetical protein